MGACRYSIGTVIYRIKKPNLGWAFTKQVLIYLAYFKNWLIAPKQ